jgi:FkbM family methyltransferase
MIELRRLVKRLLFGSTPFLRGRFRYFGQVVYFPLGSEIFERACDEGVYEGPVINFIVNLAEPGTTFLDVGANIGLLSIPVLTACPAVKVISIEPSPDTLAFLRRTQLQAHRSEDWTVIGAAVGAKAGEAEFWLAGGALGAYDGLRDTGRGGQKRAIRVPVRTLDDIWREHGCPSVSVVKIDIEGGELQAMMGAREMISQSKPVLIIEWNEKNLRAYNLKSEALLDLCAEMGYMVHACPKIIRVATKLLLKIAMAETETFILVPREQGSEH